MTYRAEPAEEAVVVSSKMPLRKALEVSSQLILNEKLLKNAKQLSKVPLIPLNCSFGVVTQGREGRSLRSSIRHERKLRDANVTVVFAVRYPGCGMCREIGQELTQLAKEESNVAMMGIVKEAGVDNSALLDFQSDYFNFPLYQDEKWNIYKALGSRRVCKLQALTTVFKCKKRMAQKKIKYKAGKGDPWMMGGILIFDRRGKLRYAMEEEFGKEIDKEAVRTAIRAARFDDSDHSSDSGDTASMSLSQDPSFRSSTKSLESSFRSSAQSLGSAPLLTGTSPDSE